MRLGLQARYTFILVAMIAIIVVPLAGTLVAQFRATATQIAETSEQAMRRNLDRQLEQRGLGMARFLADNLVNPLYAYDMEAMRQLLATALEQEDVAYVYVLDVEGRVVHDAGLLHGGVNPHNVLLGKGDTQIKLSDFSSATGHS